MYLRVLLLAYQIPLGYYHFPRFYQFQLWLVYIPNFFKYILFFSYN